MVLISIVVVLLLEYDEMLQGVELSTGTPKTDDRTLRTVYLRVLNNKVSDVIRAETKDFCDIDISLSYRVNFVGEKDKWFNVENYVKFLTDHLRSVLRNSLKQYTVSDFYANGISIVRDLILGEQQNYGLQVKGHFGLLDNRADYLLQGDLFLEENIENQDLYFSAFRNPRGTNSQLSVACFARDKQSIDLRLYDQRGRQLFKRKVRIEEGDNRFAFDAGMPLSGIYYLAIQRPKGPQVIKIILD